MKRIFCLLFTVIFIFAAYGCSGRSDEMIIIEMSARTKEMIEAMGFGDAKAGEKEGWESTTLPKLLARESGYIEMGTTHDDGTPIDFKSDFDTKFGGMDYVSSFTPKGGQFDKIMFYIHGGAYIYGAINSHAIYCDNLSYSNDALVVVPNYGLAPQYTYKEAYDMLDKVYETLLKYEKPIIILGDSAGGGLAVAYTLYLSEKGVKTPDKVVLNSPWLDVNMTNPDIPEYQKNDRMLSPYGLIEAGKYWAGDLDTSDYRISPIFGDFADFPETLMFRATWEIFYPDEVKFEKILKDSGVKIKIAELRGFMHAAPLLETLDEYTQMLDIVKDFVK